MPSVGALADALGIAGGGIIALTGAGGKTTLMYRLAAELAAEGDRVLTSTTTRILVPSPAESPCLVVSARLDEICDRAVSAVARCRHLTAAAGVGDRGRKLEGFPPAAIEALWRTGLFRWVVVEADGAAGRPLKAPAGHEPVVPAAAGWVVAVAGLDVIGKPLGEAWVFRPEIVGRLSGLAGGKSVATETIVALYAHPLGAFKSAPPGARCIAFLNQADRLAEPCEARRIAEALHAAGGGRVGRIVVGSLLPEARLAIVIAAS